jgi:YidC/Oxa1 family membrane protein insertase
LDSRRHGFTVNQLFKPMNILTTAFNVVLYQPLFNALVLLYEYLPGHDFGIAVIILTLIIKLIFYPLGTQAIKSQKILSDLQPKIKEIQKKYKDNKEQQTRATMELYQKEKINPFSGCLPLLIQLPILIALYRVFWRGLQPSEMSYLYSFVPNPGPINASFLGLINLAAPNIFLAVVAGVTQFFQAKMVMPKNQPKTGSKNLPFGDMLQKQTMYFFPIFTVLILWRLPSAIGVYWVATTIFSIIQQYVVFKKAKVSAE